MLRARPICAREGDKNQDGSAINSKTLIRFNFPLRILVAETLESTRLPALHKFELTLHSNFMNRRVTCIAIIVIVVLCAAKLYGHVIYAMYGGDIPARWNPDLYLLSHKDLVGQLGRPDVDLAGKGYQYWQKTAWWGLYELQVGYADCCTAQSLPSSVYIAAYVKGKYDPVLYKKISRAGVATESGIAKASAKNPPQ